MESKDRLEPEKTDEEETTKYLQGAKLHILTIGLCLAIFLVNFEISIVSTSLVSITDDLNEFSRASWIITAYLLTYTAFMVILAKLSDHLGRKTVLIACLLIFTIFSGACGAAQTMIQLIVFRAFQGLGASGIYSLVLIIMFEMAPRHMYPRYSVYVTSLFAISLFSGPLFGGAINGASTWRWVFLLNVPAGVVALILVAIALPNGFRDHSQKFERRASGLNAVDWIGASLMLAAITLIITGFEEASNLSPWVSSRVLAPIMVSLVPLTAFLLYERWVTLKKNGSPEPVFPWRFATNRVIVGILANTFLSGAVFTSCIIQIPLRFQAVNNETPWHAGVRLIPFGLAVPVGAGITAVACGKRRLPPIYLLFPASILQVLGLIFMSRLTLDRILWRGQYALEFLTGLGCGLSVGVATLMTPFVIEKRDLATSTSSVVQMRMLGGALLLAVITAIMNGDLKHTLPGLLSEAQLRDVFRKTQAIQTLPEPLRNTVRQIFLQGYNKQLQILLGFAAAEIPFTLLMWQKDAVRIE